MAEVFARLYHLTGDAAWREQAAGVLRAFAGQPDQMVGMPTLLGAADLLEEAAAVVIAGTTAEPLASAALSAADPAVVVLRAADTSALEETHPAFGKASPDGQPTAYVCRRGVCGLPIRDAAALTAALGRRDS
jgi:uncharacterized protein YyaL (SSP411 family)